GPVLRAIRRKGTATPDEGADGRSHQVRSHETQRSHAPARRIREGLAGLHLPDDLNRAACTVPSQYAEPKPPGPASEPRGGPPTMAESAPTPELLGTLGRLARGLSVLFWGLPIALVVCVQSAKGDWFRPLGVIPPLIATSLLFYGLNLLGGFQPQERVWRAALERVKILALINAGASPFLYW